MKKDDMDFHAYIKVLKDRRMTLLLVFAVVYAAILVATFSMKPVYRATAQVYIDPASTVELSPQNAAYQSDSAYLQTQVGIIKSEAIARKVVSRLHLDQSGKNRADNRFSITGLLGRFMSNDAPEIGSDSFKRAVNKFMSALDVTVVKNSNLVNVSYESDNPVLAANVANAAVQAYVERSIEMKAASAKQAVNWLNSELGEIKGRMTETSDQLQDFKKNKGLIVTGDGQANISLQALIDLNSKVLAAEARRSEAEIKYQQVLALANTPDGVMSHPEVINNKLIQDMKTQQGAIAKEMADNSKKFGEKHPRMVQLKSEMDSIRKQMQNEVSLIISSLRNDYEESRKAELRLKNALANQKAEAMSYERRSTEYEMKKQDVEGVRDMYTSMLKKFQESNVMGNINLSSAQLLDEASVPRSPIKPRMTLNIILGFIASLFAGVGFAFLLEHLDNTCKSPEDIEDILGLPFLGVVPTSKSFQGKQDSERFEVVSRPTSPIAEAFRNIRSNILMSSADTPPKVQLVVSSEHSEGKSMVSYNLACIMASMGDRVLLIDGDLRKPKLHTVFNIQNRQGLSSLLSQQSDLNSVILGTKVPNLSLITSGPIPPNPGELLGSAKMKNVMNMLVEKFDRIIIDSPVYQGIADASLLAAISDGVIMVVRSGMTSIENVRRTSKNLNSINIKILGAVLNDQAWKSTYYYHARNYSHYYTDKKFLPPGLLLLDDKRGQRLDN